MRLNLRNLDSDDESNESLIIEKATLSDLSTARKTESTTKSSSGINFDFFGLDLDKTIDSSSL